MRAINYFYLNFDFRNPQGDNSPSSESEEEEKEYVVEKLLDKRYPGTKGIKIQYLVKYKDYGNEHNSWESKSSLPGNIVNSFEKEQWIKNQSLQSDPRTKKSKLGKDEKQVEKLDKTVAVKSGSNPNINESMSGSGCSGPELAVKKVLDRQVSSTEIDECKEYIVEKLLDKRYPRPEGMKIQYLVKWKDYGNEHNTWEPKSSLPETIINSFEKDQWIKNKSLQFEVERAYIIEKLLDIRFVGSKGNRKQYLVKWRGFGDEHNSWEPKSSLHPKVIKSFEEELGIENESIQSEPRQN